jgi:hypothetical protein
MRRQPRSFSLLAALSALAVLNVGCGAGSAYPEPSSSGSVFSSPSVSSYAGSSSGVSELSVPHRADGRGELVVRPDAVTIVFALREKHADAQQALASLEGTVADMERRLKEATAGAASVRMCGVAIRRESASKSADDEEGATAVVVVDGSIEIGLAPELDFWKRGRLLAATAKVTASIKDAAQASKTEKEARFNEPVVMVKDLEAHRAKLAERWSKRARTFGDAAQSATAPLHLLDCAVPAHIEQRVISLEEVGLSLPMTCRLDVLGGRSEK